MWRKLTPKCRQGTNILVDFEFLMCVDKILYYDHKLTFRNIWAIRCGTKKSIIEYWNVLKFLNYKSIFKMRKFFNAAASYHTVSYSV